MHALEGRFVLHACEVRSLASPRSFGSRTNTYASRRLRRSFGLWLQAAATVWASAGSRAGRRGAHLLPLSSSL